MSTLHLGVTDLPYSEPPRTSPKAPKGDNARSTGDVAEILEAKYHIMEHFYQLHGEEIGALLADSAAGALETLMSGGPAAISLGAAGNSKIEQLFKVFITSKEMDALGYPGIPTKASILGVDHRKKGGKGSPGRPSFRDTGLYETSFKSWTD